MGSCQCGTPGPTKTYNAFINYKNAKGEDLLDVKTVGHFETIKIDGTISTIEKISSISNWAGLIPDGYYLHDELNINKTKMIILLNNTISDTLSYTFSGTQLVSCKYNKQDVTLSGESYFTVSVLK
jgi:hypothetical protein